MPPPGFPPFPHPGQGQPLQAAKLTDFRMAGALGSGTTAKVYEAVQIATGRTVAIKMLEPSQSGSEMRERFAREAILLAGVTSRHVGALVGFGFEGGRPFLVLERLHGETLDAKLRRDGPVPLPTAVRWIEQLLVGLRDCHDQQIIHRDVKPANIFLHMEGLDETVKLIDFGVARLREISGDVEGLTSSNHLIGSMGYMAPEQFRNAKTVGFTADLYAVGVVIFRTLTGRLPFVSRSLDAIIRMKAERPAPLVSSMPGMPSYAMLDEFVTKTLARDPQDRFQSTREMLEQWWNVMASLDQEASTDIMRTFGRVDESYAGPVPRASSRDPVLPPQSHSVVATYELEDERTERRQAPFIPLSVHPANQQATTLIAPAPFSAVAVPSSASEPTARDPDARETSPPKTEPAPALMPRLNESDFGDEHDDMPTRSDPELRKLVEKELELQRKLRR
jgi:serine/threonine protein kinase